MTYYEASTHKVTQSFKHMVFWGHLTDEKHFVLTATMPKATKGSSMVTLDEKLPPVKSYDHLSKWLCEITWAIENMKSHLSQYFL